MNDAATTNEAWLQYGRALIGAMHEVLEEADEGDRELLLEAADYWLGLGLVIGLERTGEAERLLGVIEADPGERAEQLSDAESLLRDALQ